MTNNTTYHSFRHSINTVHISVVFSFVFSSLIIFSSYVQYSVFYTLSLCIFSIVLSYRFQHLPYISLLSPVLSHCLLHSVSCNKCLQSPHLFLSIHTSVSIFCILVLYLLVLYILVLNLLCVISMCLLGPQLISISTIHLSSLFYILCPIHYLLFMYLSIFNSIIYQFSFLHVSLFSVWSVLPTFPGIL